MADVAGVVVSARTVGGAVTSLEDRVADAAKLARNPSLAVRATGSRAGTPITLVVAGETSRGKSSLVNAMLGAPDLLPVGPDVTTNVYVVVRAGGPRARVHLEGGQFFEAPLSDLSRWTTVAGRNVADPQALMVEVETPSALLERGLVVIDTPGVGGLDPGHSSATLAALERADALLFVLDAEAPINAPERAFLERAAACIDTVIFVVTKTDMFTGWETVHQQTRSFIARHVPRFAAAPVVPVNSVEGADAVALEAVNPKLAQAMLAKAGMERLRAEIEARVVLPGERLREANRLRAAETSIARLRGHVENTRDAAMGKDDAGAEVNAASQRLTALTQGGAKWQLKLAEDLGELGTQTMRSFHRRLTEIEVELGQLTEAKQLETFPAILEERITGLLIELNASLARGTAPIIAAVVEPLALEGIEVVPPEIRPEIPRPTPGPPPTRKGEMEEAAGIGRMVLGGFGPMAYLGMSNPFLMAIGFTLGVGMGAVERYTGSARLSLQNAQRQWGTAWQRTISPLRNEMQFEIAAWTKALKADLTTRVEAAVAERRKGLAAELARLKGIKDRSDAERSTIAADAKRQLDGLDLLAAEAANLRRAAAAQGAPRPAPAAAEPAARPTVDGAAS